MTLTLWMSGIFVVGAILMIWLTRSLQSIERRPWW
jgi:hypothetical protein